jgi:hypothetical protein
MFSRHAVDEAALSGYLDGALDERAGARVEAHLASCAGCRVALAELRALRSALQALPQVTAPRSFALREADVRPRAAARAPLGFYSRALSGVMTAAFLVFVMLVGLDVLGSGSMDEGTGGAALSEAPRNAADGESALPSPLPSTSGFSESDQEAPSGDVALDERRDGEAGAATEEPAPEPAGAPAATRDNDGSDALLRAGEAAAGAVAIGAAGGLFFVVRRRRAEAGR